MEGCCEAFLAGGLKGAAIPFGEDQAPQIAVIVPVFRHSVFLADAVGSALAQENAPAHRIVIVNDGCPHAETHRVATALACSFPGQVEYIRRTNGGLSAARNSGVSYALARWPSVRAIYFLDADNWIEPNALGRAFRVLMSDRQTGWVYPDIAMFGEYDWIFDYSGQYSIISHLAANISEAGSMVRREVFDKGCRFDESMRLGYEDWEFWWQCISAGFTGQHVPFFGLRYRKRPESMLSEASREHSAVLAYMHRKHRRLFRAHSLVSLEAQRAPRYALVSSGPVVRLCTDPARTDVQLTIGELVNRIVISRQQPFLHVAPRLIVAVSEETLSVLSKLCLDRWVFWWLEVQVAFGTELHVAGVALRADPSHTGVRIRILDSAAWPGRRGPLHMIAMRQATLYECMDDPSDEWIWSLTTARPLPRAAVLQINIGQDLMTSLHCPGVICQFFSFFEELHCAARVRSAAMPSAKERSYSPCIDDNEIPRRLFGCGPLFPVVREGQQRHATFVLPVVSHGGVEKVALNIAAEFQYQGWHCHLLILSSQAQLTEKWQRTFETISFYHEKDFDHWSGGEYLGTPYPKWNRDGDDRLLKGLLVGVDAVFGFHAAPLHRILGELRQGGVATAASLQVNDLTILGREVGHPFHSIGYEHAYDIFACGSASMLQWCHAMGVPRDKLIEVPCAPSYTLTPPQVAEILANREKNNSPLRNMRALFLGRLDRQKGLDRLAAMIQRCERLGLPVEWRLVGSRVITEDTDELPPGLLKKVEPAVSDEAELTALYAWADVLILPSYWEGLPLTLLEAMRLGAVPIVSRVGAMEEVVNNFETGILIESGSCDRFARDGAQVLETLVADRSLLARLSHQAAAAVAPRNWHESCRKLITKINEIVAHRQSV
ncbi:MAG TPA: glycosyltransferase [Methylocella sp.]|nr:glycosyltransferase [Methylocella sp.]